MAQWVAAGAAVLMLLVQLGMAVVLLQIKISIHSELEKFRACVEDTFETKELAAHRADSLRQRIDDLRTGTA